MNYELMRKSGLVLMVAGLLAVASAMGQVARAQSDMDSLSQRVNLFGSQLPQEKVFLHLDNTAYFLGDTIFYQAYVTRTDRGTLSTLSGVLYVELLNADGYLVERQIVQLQTGMGQGSVVLNTGRAQYAGYYELRAYTRWMLNFGRTVLPHNRSSEDWFVRRNMARDYFVDYEKIYSRTFPVYDAPQAHGEYWGDMTMRPMQRLMGRTSSNERYTLRLLPEGGTLVAGVDNRLYFEAATSEGRHLRGEVVVSDNNGVEMARAATEHRGKGVLHFTPQRGMRYRAVLMCADTVRAQVNVPAASDEGVVLQPTINDNSLRCHIEATSDEEMNLCITHTGIVRHWQRVERQGDVVLQLEGLPQGVLDITIYNNEGRILADRLVFNQRALSDNRICVEGQLTQYAPYQAIDLRLRRNAMPARTVVSVSVVDADNSDLSADNGTMLTEMLLCSELKGFIEQPTYYFEADDSTHRAHLDLLMATQGWRRFSWRRQSMPERFVVHELNEPTTPRLSGAVYVYEAIRRADALQDYAEADLPELMSGDEYDFDAPIVFSSDADNPMAPIRDAMNAEDAARQSTVSQGAGRDRYQENPGNLSNEVTVHAEFVQPGEEPLVGEVNTERSMFNIVQPEFYGRFYMHLAAADTTGWGSERVTRARRARHSWVVADETQYPEYYVRIADPFPRHSHPYTFYRTQLIPQSMNSIEHNSDRAARSIYDDITLDEVVVRSRRAGKRRFDAQHPALAMRAYTAFNMVCDAGLCPGQFVGAERLAGDVARMLMSDMGVDRQYRLQVRRNGLPASHTMSEAERATFDVLENLDSVFVYTDYAPRLYGNPQWQGDNQPEVVVDVRKAANDARQMTYRDRFYVRQGFNVCEEFYQPDYSQATPEAIDGVAADMRRTLLWIPVAMLDDDGTLNISTYNNGKPTHIRVTVNGIDAHGNPVSN